MRPWNALELPDTPIIRPALLALESEGMFHITGHGIDDLHCFGDHRDKSEFIERFARILSAEPVWDYRRREMYPWLRPAASLVAYCILDNHYHVILRQYEQGGAARVMRSVLSSYGRYFNARHRRSHTQIFRAPYGVRRIGSSRQGRRTLMYVNLNHEVELDRYEFSSHEFHAGLRRGSLVDVESALWFFDGEEGEYRRAVIDEGLPAVDRKVAARSGGSKLRRDPIRRGRPTHHR